jgi:phosphotriesterase-related protein
MIQTARGPIEPDALGLTLMHEHLCILSDGVPQAFPRTFDRDATIAEAIARVNEAAGHGVQSILDLTVLGLGRDIELIGEVAAQVDVNILVATGAYTFDQLPAYFRNRPVDHLAEQFIRDIEDGVADSGIHAAAIKCTTDAPGVTTDVDKLLRASARAHLATGTLLNTHSNPKARTGLEQLRVFGEEGVDLQRVIIGHCGDTDDLDYLLEVADSGAFMGMDRFGIDASLPVDRRVAMVVELVRRGHGPQLILSHDCVCYIDWFPRDSGVLATRTMSYLFVDVVPELRKAGLDEVDIDMLLVDNPRRALTGEV